MKLAVAVATASLGLVDARMSLLAQKQRPIAKVIKMLEDMQSQLEAEAEDDAAVYEKLTCWCKTNREEKETAITLAEQKIAQLEAALGEDAAKIKELKAKEVATREENRKNQKALDEATELRMEERKAFHEEEKDSLATIEACKQAIVVLSKHHPELAQLKSVAKILKKSTQHVAEKSTIEGVMALRGFLDDVESAGSFLQIPGFQSHAPASGQIFGMLKQMKETFEANLSTAQKEELAKRDTYQQLKAAKTAELKAGREQLANTKAEYAKFKEKFAQEEEDLAATQEQLGIDQEFLANLNEKCAAHDADYAARTKSRNEEIAAVADTIKILDSDTSFDAMTKTVDGAEMVGSVQESFIQLSESKEFAKNKQRIVSLLESVATKSPQIALIATYAKLDAFTKVKAAIAKMVDELKAQQADEVKHRDFCIQEFQENKLATEKENDNHANLVAKIGELTAQIETLTSELDTLTKEIAEMTTQSKRAKDDRGLENADFQAAIKDQRVTQMILAKAIARMEQKYAFFQQQPGGPHIQTSATHTDPGNGPAAFAGASQQRMGRDGKLINEGAARNAGGAKVIALLNKVRDDSLAVEKELIKDETDAQVAYEGFVKDTNKSIDSKQKSIAQKTEERATASKDKSAANSAREAAETHLQELSDYNGEIHKSCDFVMDNFDTRQEARAQEMEALKQASAILSGMKF